MEGTLSRKARISLLLISLLIHTTLLMMLCISLSDPHAQKVAAEEKKAALLKALHQLPKPAHRWAATKARASQFGVPVIFNDEPEQQPQATHNAPTPAATASVAPQQAAPSNQQKVAVQQQQQPPEQREKQEEVEQKPTETLSELSDIKPLTSIQEYKKPNAPSADHKKQTEKIVEQSQTQTIQAAVQQSPSSATQSIAPPQSTGAGGTRKPITLAQITKGFVENLKNKGDHLVTMKGDKNGVPTDEQLKYERYLQRIQWCVQNSIKIHQRHYVPSTPFKTSLDVYVALDRDGKLAELTLVRSSGVPDLDEFILFAFKDASTSFPPMPAFFKKELFTVLFYVKCAEALQSGFGLSMH